MSNDRAGILSALAIPAVVFIVFGQVLRSDFVAWDDGINIYENRQVQGLDAERVRWMFADLQQALRYKPLSWLSWALIHQFFGLDPFGYHLANLLLHASNSSLLFLLIQKLLLLCRDDARDPATTRGIRIAAGFGALLWALHPLRVEVVAWATALPYGQALFFLLLSLLCYLSANDGSVTGGVRAALYWGSVALFLLSTLTYPVSLGAVPVFVVLDVYLLRRFSGAAGRQGHTTGVRLWLEKIPFFVTAGLMITIALYARAKASGRWMQPESLEQFDALSRAMQAFYIWAYYGWKPLIPFGLSPVYTTLVALNPLRGVFILSALMVVATTVVLMVLRRRFPGSLALWACHLALLIPVLGLTEHPHFPSDRYGYIVATVWALAVAGAVAAGYRVAYHRSAWIIGGSFLLCLLGLMSAGQCQIWRNSQTLFERAIQRLGNDPYRSDLYYRLGVIQLRTGHDAQAAKNLAEAVRIAPDLAQAHSALGDYYAQHHQADAAVLSYREALRLAPNDIRARHNLGLAFDGQGRTQEAITEFYQALRNDPDNATVHHSLGISLGGAGRLNDALKHFAAALEFDPKNPDLRQNIAVTLARLGRTNEAALQLQEVRKLRGATGSP